MSPNCPYVARKAPAVSQGIPNVSNMKEIPNVAYLKMLHCYP